MRTYVHIVESVKFVVGKMLIYVIYKHLDECESYLCHFS